MNYLYSLILNSKFPRNAGLCMIFLFTIISCNKYLEEKSNSSLVTPSTIEDLQALLDFPEYINFATPMFPEASCDDYFTEDFYLDLFAGTNDEFAYKWEKFDYKFPNDWSMSYRPIYYANLCSEMIDKIEKTPINQSDWDNLKGSALFLRAYYHLQLVWTFAKAYDENMATNDLGIVVRLTSDFNVPSVRTNVKGSYDQIIADAKASIDLLPVVPVQVTRPSKTAALGLLARTYLSMRKYDSAYKYSNLALGMKNDLLNYNDPTEVDVNSESPFSQFNEEIVFYTQVNSSFLYIAINTLGMVDTVLYSLYNEHDLRRTAFFTPGGSYNTFKNYNSGFDMYSGISTNELYLIRAESLARGGNNNGVGDKDGALNDLNELLQNRWESAFFAPLTAATAQEALDIILLERRKELLRRGLRWIDIKRLNKEGAVIVPKRIVKGNLFRLEPNDNKYALPIPNDIIEQSGIAQN